MCVYFMESGNPHLSAFWFGEDYREISSLGCTCQGEDVWLLATDFSTCESLTRLGPSLCFKNRPSPGGAVSLQPEIHFKMSQKT